MAKKKTAETPQTKSQVRAAYYAAVKGLSKEEAKDLLVKYKKLYDQASQ